MWWSASRESTTIMIAGRFAIYGVGLPAPYSCRTTLPAGPGAPRSTPFTFSVTAPASPTTRYTVESEVNTFVSPAVNIPSKILFPPLPCAALTQAACPVTVTSTVVPAPTMTGDELDASGVAESVTAAVVAGVPEGDAEVEADTDGDTEGVGVGVTLTLIDGDALGGVFVAVEPR